MYRYWFKMEKEKKQEDTLKIIALFREREVLWNMCCLEYRRKDLREVAFYEIAEAMDTSVEFVKKRIRALRSTYIIEKHKVEKSKRSGCNGENKYEPQLFWYNHMKFLDKTIVMRKPFNKGNYSDESLDMEESQHSDIDFAASTSKHMCKDQTTIQRVNMNKIDYDVYSAFAESMAMQLRTMSEERAFQTMTEMQNLIYQRKFGQHVQLPPKSTQESHDSYVLLPQISDTDSIIKEENDLFDI